MITYKDNYIKIPPQRPYCWGDKKEFDKETGLKYCKQCGFREECKANIK
jgi:hypothetical protein